jgi:hypothetical protein
MLLEMGVQNLPPVGHDVLIGSFLVNSLRREQTLTELAEATWATTVRHSRTSTPKN